ncbi:MAG: hypothetical protein R2770_15885 [Acidimicrobiales bacterium]|nr:J domain-containing protein [Acidimicrobiales bacterium]
MIVAEFEVWHSRPVAPTRRVAITGGKLPIDPAPGYGGLLLAGIVAAYSKDLDEETHDDLVGLMAKVVSGAKIPQPQLRHRFQVDRVGLSSSKHRLLVRDGELVLSLEPDCPPAPQVLAAVYRTGQFEPSQRRSIMTLVSSATRWRHGNVAGLIPWLTGDRVGDQLGEIIVDPKRWACDVFGFESDPANHREVQRRFRALLRDAHPDHGGESEHAAAQIMRLNEARRILLAKGA